MAARAGQGLMDEAAFAAIYRSLATARRARILEICAADLKRFGQELVRCDLTPGDAPFRAAAHAMTGAAGQIGAVGVVRAVADLDAAAPAGRPQARQALSERVAETIMWIYAAATRLEGLQ